VGMVGLLFGDRELVADAIDEPNRGMQAQILSGISDDGPWYEGAWGYHFYTMSALAPLAEAAHRAGLPIYSGEVGERYKKFYLAPLAMALPNGSLPAFNDSNTANANGNAHYELAFARWGDVRFAEPVRASNRKSLYALTVGVERLPAPATQAAPSEVFPASGYAYLRAGAGTDAAALILKYGPHGGGHGHPDKLHFVLYMGGKMLADDAGITTYGVPVHEGYYKTTLAHNTLVVDEENQRPATGKLLDFKTGNGWSAALADAGPIYEGVTFRRAAFLLGTNAAVFLDMAATTDGNARLFDFAVHPLVSPKLPLLSGNERPVDRPGYSYLRNLTTHHGLPAQNQTDFRLMTNGLNMDMDIDGRTTSLLAATGVGRSTEDRIPVFIFRQKTTGTRLAWSLGTASAIVTQVAVTDSATNKPVPETDAAAANVRVGDRSYLLIANPSGRAILAGNYRGSDKLAVVPIPPFPAAEASR
jgi:oligo-alginate lyase